MALSYFEDFLLSPCAGLRSVMLEAKSKLLAMGKSYLSYLIEIRKLDIAFIAIHNLLVYLVTSGFPRNYKRNAFMLASFLRFTKRIDYLPIIY